MLDAPNLQSEEHAAEVLAMAYQNAPYGEQTTQLLLFGIKYADDLEHLSLGRIVKLAHARGLHPTANVEVNHGRRLAKYVTLF